MKLKDIINKSRDRDFALIVNWRHNPPAKLSVLENPQIVKYDFSGMNF